MMFSLKKVVSFVCMVTSICMVIPFNLVMADTNVSGYYCNFDDSTWDSSKWTVVSPASITRNIAETYDNTPGSAEITVPANAHSAVTFGGVNVEPDTEYEISFRIKLPAGSEAKSVEIITNNPILAGSENTIGKIGADADHWADGRVTYFSTLGLPISKLYFKVGDGITAATYYLDELKITKNAVKDRIKNANFECTKAITQSDAVLYWNLESTLNYSIGGAINDFQTTAVRASYSKKSGSGYLNQTKPVETVDDSYLCIYNAMTPAVTEEAAKVYPADGVHSRLYQTVDLKAGTYYKLGAYIKTVLTNQYNSTRVEVNIKDQNNQLINADCQYSIANLASTSWTEIDKTIYIERDVSNAVVELCIYTSTPNGADKLSMAGRKVTNALISSAILYRYALDNFRFEPVNGNLDNNSGFETADATYTSKPYGWKLTSTYSTVNTEPSASAALGTGYAFITNATYSGWSIPLPADGADVGNQAATLKYVVAGDATHPVTYPADGLKMSLSSTVPFCVKAGMSYDVGAYTKIRVTSGPQILGYKISLINTDGAGLEEILGSIDCTSVYSGMSKSSGIITVSKDASNCSIRLDFDLSETSSVDQNGQITATINYHFYVDNVYIRPILISLDNVKLLGNKTVNSTIHADYTSSGSETIGYYEYKWYKGVSTGTTTAWTPVKSGISDSNGMLLYPIAVEDVGMYFKLVMRAVSLNNVKGDFESVETLYPAYNPIAVPSIVNVGQKFDLPISYLNEESSSQSAIAVLAFYDHNKLVNVITKSAESISTGEKADLSMTQVEVPTGADSAKVFILRSLDDIKPLLNSHSINVTNN